MPSQVMLRETLQVGTRTVFESSSPTAQFAVVFEDDGETGYFYGLDQDNKQQPILDALYIYDVNRVADRDEPSTLEIVWSDDGLKACLVINNFPHAVFDFQNSKAYCRNNFPPPNGQFTDSHEWNDIALDLFN